MSKGGGGHSQQEAVQCGGQGAAGGHRGTMENERAEAREGRLTGVRQMRPSKVEVKAGRGGRADRKKQGR